MASNTKVPSVTFISHLCYKCKGHHWDSTNNARTQANAQEEFGLVPNACVKSNDGSIKCPYVLGLL